jgi:lipopolysaccharide export system permease protein
MSIIHKYLTVQISKYFGIVLVAVVGIYMSVDFFERIDDIMEVKLPLIKALSYFVFNTPFIVAQIIPVCILLAVLIVFGLMSRNNEIIALKSSGVHVYYLLKPVLLMGIILSIFVFLFSEIVVPITSARANQIWLRDVRKESSVFSKEKNIWMKGNREIIYIKFYNPKAKTIYGVTLNQFDRAFRLVRRVDAKKGVYNGGQWVLSGVVEQNLDKRDGSYKVDFYPNKAETFEFKPEDLKQVIKNSEATVYRVDLYVKTAFPLVSMIVCILATGIAFRNNAREALPVNIVCGIGVAFLYWIFLSFCISLGYGERLPPFIAAWTANFIFLCLGGITLLNVK